MSAYSGLSDNTSRHLRRIQRQMRLLDLRLQLLRERLLADRLQSLTFHHCCLHLPDPQPPARRALLARMDLERRMDRMQRFGRMSSSSRNRSRLALVDMKGFDPNDVTVMVKDRKVTVLAEHRDECNTSAAKTYNYRKLMKEFNLPAGVSENEVTCSLEPNSVMKIETSSKGCLHLNY